jgi:hypothetical protein
MSVTLLRLYTDLLPHLTPSAKSRNACVPQLRGAEHQRGDVAIPTIALRLYPDLLPHLSPATQLNFER